MVESTDLTELVKHAQRGNEDSRNRLAELIRPRLYSYVQRMSLRHDVTEDIVQESMIEMLRFLDKLERADRFWPWLRRIAINKLHHHHARQKTRHAMSMEDVQHTLAHDNSREGFAEMVTDELKHIVVESLGDLKPRYREVLVMRCYEEMDYSRIAEELGTTEFSSRVLFFRAKNALAKKLARRGLSRGAVITALVIFGRMTAESKAAAAQISIVSGTMKVGAAAAGAAVLTSKATVATVAAVGFLAVGSAVIPPDSPEISSVAPDGAVSAVSATLGASANEYWYYYPDGADGAVMIRRTMTLGDNPNEYCQWLQNEQGNYYFDARANTVHVNNFNLWDRTLLVRRLPTDSAAMSEFLSRVQPESQGMDQVTDREAGLLVIARPEGQGAPTSWTTHHLHMLKETYFKCDWPKDVRMVDRRDDLHKQGWVHFQITGSIGSDTVMGEGRIPLVYEKWKQAPPVFRIQTGYRLLIQDSPEGASVYDRSSMTETLYPPGSFFEGLMRPWAGLHTIDTVRRDAARRQIWFKSRVSEDETIGQVRLECGSGSVVYSIDMERDLLTQIDLEGTDATGKPTGGSLHFQYQNRAGSPLEFLTPRPQNRSKSDGSASLLWLLRLVQ
ncbi:MAG: RNA polymerase sigma factor [Sedimentisphaerales bacterium]|nr:RNA polymerase sigma factor [Sedimentisphaerales bacterium]